MSLTVYTSRNHRELYPNATRFSVVGNHLYIEDEEEQTLAIYAPEHWRAVFRTEQMSA